LLSALRRAARLPLTYTPSKMASDDSGCRDLGDGDLPAALHALTNAEFVYQEALYPEAEYSCKHPSREAADGLLKVPASDERTERNGR
jgi:hypothetical protein